MLVEEETGKVLGAHLVGHGAPEIIHIFQFAMLYGVTADQLKNNSLGPPNLRLRHQVSG